MLRAMRARAEHATRPVLLMSAAAPPPSIESDGWTRFLRKPFDIDDLLDAMTRVVAGPAPAP
jgi:hypothetical protein